MSDCSTLNDAVALHAELYLSWPSLVHSSAQTLNALAQAESIEHNPSDNPLQEYGEFVDSPAHPLEPARNHRMHGVVQWLALNGASTEINEDSIGQLMGKIHGLPSNMPLRVDPAYSHDGRREHSIVFKEYWLKSIQHWTTVKEQSPYVTAVARYLDAIFFHPFDDGNARLARVLLQWQLQRAQVALPSLPMVVALPKRVGNTEDYLRLVRVCAMAVVQRKQRLEHHKLCHNS